MKKVNRRSGRPALLMLVGLMVLLAGCELAFGATVVSLLLVYVVGAGQ